MSESRPSTPPLSFNGGFLVTFIYFVEVYEGNKEQKWATWLWYYCVWSLGIECSHTGLPKNAKEVNGVNDELKGLKNNFRSLKIRVYDTIIFSGKFFICLKRGALFWQEKRKFHLKPVVRETLKTENWRLEKFTLLCNKICELCRSVPTLYSQLLTGSQSKKSK